MSWRHKHRSKSYRSRKVVIRGKGGVGSDVSHLEDLTRDLFPEILEEHLEELEEIATYIEEDARDLVPLKTGALEASIMVRVSRSFTKPGLIAHASAINAGFDYALIQEEDEEFSHDRIGTYQVGEGSDIRTVEYLEETGRSAHYLGGPFARHISDLYEEITGEELELSEELQHAKEYVEDFI